MKYGSLTSRPRANVPQPQLEEAIWFVPCSYCNAHSLQPCKVKSPIPNLTTRVPHMARVIAAHRHLLETKK